MLRFLSFLVGSFFFVLISLGLAYTYAISLYEGAGPLTEERLILIPKGAGLNLIARKLENEGLIHSKWLFIGGARIEAVESELKAGEYLVPPAVSAKDLLDMIANGRIYLRQFTVAEGLSSHAIVDILNAMEDMSGLITTIPPEGSLMPETYRFQFNDDRNEQLGLMRQSMQDTLAMLWQTRAPNLPLNTPEEAVILASIVEKETGVAGERNRVAGVFLNRLRIGMPLQSDPTVIYAMTEGKAPLGRPLYRKDLGIDSPYNTYRYGGLPPAPICNPGRASLEAVLNPEQHRYLYFVADGTGGHVFATNLEDHNRNVAQWRIIRDRLRAEQEKAAQGINTRPAPGHSLAGSDDEDDAEDSNSEEPAPAPSQPQKTAP